MTSADPISFKQRKIRQQKIGLDEYAGKTIGIPAYSGSVFRTNLSLTETKQPAWRATESA